MDGRGRAAETAAAHGVGVGVRSPVVGVWAVDRVVGSFLSGRRVDVVGDGRAGAEHRVRGRDLLVGEVALGLLAREGVDQPRACSDIRRGDGFLPIRAAVAMAGGGVRGGMGDPAGANALRGMDGAAFPSGAVATGNGVFLAGVVVSASVAGAE